MKTVSQAFKDIRNRGNIKGTSRKVVLTDLTGSQTAITLTNYNGENLVQKISRIIDRVERKTFNNFQPPAVTVTVKDDEMFFKSDKTGLFDDWHGGLQRGYRLQIYVTLTQVYPYEWILVFDGKVGRRPKRPNRETAVFSATGWLQDLENVNAELIADPNNEFVFRNISGVSVDYYPEGPQGRLGVVKMDFGMEGTSKYLQYCDGNKVFVTGDETNLPLYDKMKQRSIRVDVDYSELPDQAETDNFVIRQTDEGIKACYFYENAFLEDVLEEIFKACDIDTYDIDIADLESQIGRSFTYLSTVPPAAGTEGAIEAIVTEAVLTSYSNNIATMLVWVRSRMDNNEDNDQNWLCKITIDTSTHEVNYEWVAEGNGFYNGQNKRGVGFFHFASSWWTITGNSVDGAGRGDRISAAKLYKLNSNASGVDYTFDFSSDASPAKDDPNPDCSTDQTWVFYLARAAGTFDDDDLYIPFAQRVGGGNPVASLQKLHWNGSSLTQSGVKALHGPGGSINNIFPDDVACCAWQQGIKKCFFYGMRLWTSPFDLNIFKYDITSDSFEKIWNDSIEGRTMERARSNHNSTNNQYRAILVWQHTSSNKYMLSIHHNGNWHGMGQPASNKSKNIDRSSSQALEKFYTYWWNSPEGYQIGNINVETGNIVNRENGFLRGDYEISEIGPMLYEEIINEEVIHNYCGLVLQPVTKQLIPFLFSSQILGTIPKLDTTEMNARQLLQKLAEDYCCVIDVYEKGKARFYYRALDKDPVATLNETQYNLQPKLDYWGNKVDGVRLYNPETKEEVTKGKFGFNRNCLDIEVPYVTGQALDITAQRYYDFLEVDRLIGSIIAPFFVELEALDKITVTLKDKDGGEWRTYDMLVYEKSFDSEPKQEGANDVILKLVQFEAEPKIINVVSVGNTIVINT